jgi:glycosyltransferase involved in cell wall biosynthesis
MKRVLFYDDVPIYGGHQATAVAAARHLATNGVEVVSAFPAANERLARAWASLGDAVRRLPIDVRLTRWQPFLSPFGIAAGPVLSLLRDVAPDVVVAVQGTIVQSNRAVEQSRRLGIPVVSFVPMGVHFAPGLWFQAFIARVLERYHYKRPDAFLTISENSRRELVAGGARAPVRVVYCGADLARLRRVPREAHDRYTLAIIGRVSFGTKGHDVLLRALTLVPDARLVIAGDGPDDARVDALISELRLDDRVRRLPWQEDMSAVYSSADMVVIPSRFEGLPLVALEAMFYELPVVAADMGAMREVLPESWLFPVGDFVACAAAIERVRHTDIRDVLAANRERVLRELNEEQYGQRFRAALEDLYGTIRRASR